MARTSRRILLAAGIPLLLAPTVYAQITDLPDLDTATQTSDGTSEATGDATTDNDADATSEGTATETSAESTADSNDDEDETTTETTAARTTASTQDRSDASTGSGFTATTTGETSGSGITDAPSLTSNGPSSVFHLISDAPTIAGAGIPDLYIPWTAGAPFMQKSTLPEGTVFIVIGAILAFFGACVLLWRGLVAWSITRSVKRAAMASVGGTEKSSSTYWGGSSGYRTVAQKNGSMYKDIGSSMSLDQLTSAGKPMKPHFRDSTIERRDTPPADLFFSPTAKVNNRDSMLSHRNSGYMPSGYYAAPNSMAAGGAAGTTLGGDGNHSIAPYANRNSTFNPSPPGSPSLPPTRSSAGLRGSRGDLRPPPSREGRNSMLNLNEPRSGHASGIYSQPSNSSLMVGGNSVSDLPGSRAPSAYLEDLFENHGNGPRERF